MSGAFVTGVPSCALPISIHREAGGAIVLDGSGAPTMQHADDRWSSTGGTARNAKGEPVRMYEPYFSDRPDFEDDVTLRTLGMPTEQFFDAAGRVVRRPLPHGGMERVEFGAWHERHYDANATFDGSGWRLFRAKIRRPSGRTRVGK